MNNTVIFGAIAHMSVEIVNEIRPVINIFVRSNVSDSFPIGRIKAAENSKKMVITRFRFSATKLNFLAMSGAAMLIALDIKGTKNEEVVVAIRIFLLIFCSSVRSILYDHLFCVL